MARILIIDDHETMREGMVQILSRDQHDVVAAANGKDGLALYKKHMPDFVITDLKMEGIDGIEVLKAIHEINSEAHVMMITAFGTIDIAVEAMKLGAFDFITKPFPPELLRVKVSQALKQHRMADENRFFRKESAMAVRMVGKSSVLEELQDQIGRAAQVDSTVLISGESGSGKELVARAIHQESQRAKGPFIKTDCASLSEGILESELFGHERGAFTGAIARKVGRFELADGGTLFLDEIGNISSSVQAKLLRVLQDRCFERVGGTKPIKVDTRIITATNRDLAQEVEQGRFRQDLFYRLHIVPIHVPALRERAEDIPLLVEWFLSRWRDKTGRSISLAPDTFLTFQHYAWPGNIRELENILERLCVLAKQGVIKLEDLPPEMSATKVSNQAFNTTANLEQALQDVEKSMILQALEECGGVKTKAAKKLGIKTSTLYYKMEKYRMI